MKRGTAWGQSAPWSFRMCFYTQRCCLGMGKLRDCSSAGQSQQLRAAQEQWGKQPRTRAQFEAWISVFYQLGSQLGLVLFMEFSVPFVAVTSELTPNQPISAHAQVPMGDALWCHRHPANFFPQAAGSRLWPHSASSAPLAWRVLCHTWVQPGCL